MFNSKKLFGFTMPEVLIVVGIIGVVAAITTPITNKYFNDIAFEHLVMFFLSGHLKSHISSEEELVHGF